MLNNVSEEIVVSVFMVALNVQVLFHTVDTVHLRHIKLSYRPTDAQSVGL
jgi:hypothetical protein